MSMQEKIGRNSNEQSQLLRLQHNKTNLCFSTTANETFAYQEFAITITCLDHSAMEYFFQLDSS